MDRQDRNSENREPAQDGSYRIVRPEQTRSDYSDAGYIPQAEAPDIRAARFSAPPEPKPAPTHGRRPHRGISAGTVVCLCVICGILGGIFGGAVGGLFTQRGAVTLPETAQDVRAEASAADAQTDAPSPAVQSLAAETGNPGSTIYAAGCPQTVGVTTEVTTRNFFGQVSTRSVMGSGFIFSSDGYILTNHHVIEAAQRGGYKLSVMLYDGESCPAEIVGYSRDGTDLAVLKIEKDGLSPVTLGSSAALQVGETVYALGNPLGELAYTMTTGCVSALDREITTNNSYTGLAETVNAFQFDAAVNEGNSGGPLYNARGEVVGIVTAKYSSAGVEGLGFAIPIDEAAEIASALIGGGSVSGRAVLGISGETVSAGVARYYGMVQGVYVWTVKENSGAARAGLRPGDIITAVGATPVTSTGELEAAERGYRAGDSAVLTVCRSGETLQTEVVFDGKAD